MAVSIFPLSPIISPMSPGGPSCNSTSQARTPRCTAQQPNRLLFPRLWDSPSSVTPGVPRVKCRGPFFDNSKLAFLTPQNSLRTPGGPSTSNSGTLETSSSDTISSFSVLAIHPKHEASSDSRQNKRKKLEPKQEQPSASQQVASFQFKEELPLSHPHLSISTNFSQGCTSFSYEDDLAVAAEVHLSIPQDAKGKNLSQDSKQRSPKFVQISWDSTSSPYTFKKSFMFGEDTLNRHPHAAVKESQRLLTSEDWKERINGLSLVKRLAQNHPDALRAHLQTILPHVASNIDNLRSQVPVLASQVLTDLAKILKFDSSNNSDRYYIERIISSLLQPSISHKTFLRATCAESLDHIMGMAPPSFTIPVLIKEGARHKNEKVRATTARLLAELTKHLGADRVFAKDSAAGPRFSKELRKKLVATLASLVCDSSSSVRFWSREGLLSLRKHEQFDELLQKCVSSSLHYEQVSRKLSDLASRPSFSCNKH